MKAKFSLLVGIVLYFSAFSAMVFAQGTVFTYQGKLSASGSAANGSYDFSFTLWDSVSGGAQIGGLSASGSTLVSNGIFTVFLDFGSIPFNGNARWLEVGVRTNGSTGEYTVLNPRQPFT